MFLKTIHPKFYLQTSICLILVVLGAFTEAIGLGLVMPLISIILGQSSEVGLASYISSFFKEFGWQKLEIVNFCFSEEAPFKQIALQQAIRL